MQGIDHRNTYELDNPGVAADLVLDLKMSGVSERCIICIVGAKAAVTPTLSARNAADPSILHDVTPAGWAALAAVTGAGYYEYDRPCHGTRLVLTIAGNDNSIGATTTIVTHMSVGEQVCERKR
jgi:hypothetical protein